MEIDYIFPLRIVSSKKSARAKILTEWKTVFRPNILQVRLQICCYF